MTTGTPMRPISFRAGSVWRSSDDCWGTQQRQQPNATRMLPMIRCVQPQTDLDRRLTVSSEKEKRTSFLFGPESDGYFTQAWLPIFACDRPVVAIAARSAL